MTKLALKRLTASDLTFFEWQYRNLNVGKQKGINLNADVFVGALFPALKDSLDERIPIDLYVYGPGLHPELNLQRKVIKGDAYKNWRLDGELINNPPDGANRFDSLKEGDIAVFEFNDGMLPSTARLVLAQASAKEDGELHRILNGLIPKSPKSMVAVSPQQLWKAIEEAKVGTDHPVSALLLAPEIEDAAQGNVESVRRLRSRKSKRRILRSELLSAKRQAEENGQRGEELVNAYLQAELDGRRIKEFCWESNDNNAVAPYDFTLLGSDDAHGCVDVKATAYEFERPLHLSLAELIEMRDQPSYSLYRVFEMSEAGGKLRIASNLKGFATDVLKVLQQLPDGIAADGISVRPELLKFGPVISLRIPE